MSIEIMARVWKSEGTSGSLRLMLLAIADNANDQGECYPSLAYLARKTGCSRSYAKQLVYELRDLGYIEIENRKSGEINTSNIYRISFDRLGGREAGLPGGREAGCTRVGIQAVHKPSVNQVLEEDKGEIFKLYEQSTGQIITGKVADLLMMAEEEYSMDWIREAFRLTAENAGRSWSYTKAILDGWKRNGYKSDTRRKAKKPVKEEHFWEEHS